MACAFTEATTNLSTDMAVGISRKFLRSMAQEVGDEQLGISLWNENMVKKKGLQINKNH
jgi:DNA excision repair protein ERCC-2